MAVPARRRMKRVRWLFPEAWDNVAAGTFAGAGGGILGGAAGWRTVCAVEYAAHAAECCSRGSAMDTAPRFPIWDDVRTFDGKPGGGMRPMLSAAKNLAPTSATATTGSGWPANRADYGETWPASLAKFDPASCSPFPRPAIRSGMGDVHGDRPRSAITLGRCGNCRLWGLKESECGS